MITVRTIPEAPTKQPATISTLLRITNPAAEAAMPEKLLRNEMTPGMSPPPIGITPKTPNASDNKITGTNAQTD